MFLLTRTHQHSFKFEWFLIADTSQSIPTQYFISTPATGSTAICLRYTIAQDTAILFKLTNIASQSYTA